MDDQSLPQQNIEPTMPTNEPVSSPTESLQSEPQVQPQPEKKPSLLIAIALIVTGIIALAITCYFVFLAPKPTQDSSTQDDSDVAQDEPSEQTNDDNLPSLMPDGKWKISFPSEQSNEAKTFEFTLPSEITDIQSTINKQLYPYYGHEIISLVTETETYNYKTLCDSTDALGIFAGVYRVPHGEARESADGTEYYLISEDDIYDYYAEIGPDGYRTCLGFNSTKFEEAKKLLKELFNISQM